jgi:hypothetical protein
LGGVSGAKRTVFFSKTSSRDDLADENDENDAGGDDERDVIFVNFS